MKKLNSSVVSIQNGLRETKKEKKKILVPNSVPTRAGLPFQKKKAKKLKNIIPTQFLYKPG